MRVIKFDVPPPGPLPLRADFGMSSSWQVRHGADTAAQPSQTPPALLQLRAAANRLRGGRRKEGRKEGRKGVRGGGDLFLEMVAGLSAAQRKFNQCCSSDHTGCRCCPLRQERATVDKLRGAIGAHCAPACPVKPRPASVQPPLLHLSAAPAPPTCSTLPAAPRSALLSICPLLPKPRLLYDMTFCAQGGRIRLGRTLARH